MKFKFFFFVLLAFTLFDACTTGVRSRDLLFRNNEFAIYSVKRENIRLKVEKSLDSRFAHPLEISEEKILDVLGNLRYKQESSYGNLDRYVFEEAEIKDFASDLADGLQRVKPDELLLVVSKYNSVKSVVSHYERTGFYIWSTESSIEILFGEIQKEIGFEEQGNYFDWSRIPDISFDHTPDASFLLPSSQFQFRTVEGFKNKRWVVFDKKELSRVKFEKRKVSKSKEIAKSVDSDMTPEKRIQRDEEDEVIGD
ncbi:LA_1326/LA_4305 family lipoprotein [Leptospira idonii]|uniref:Lipoprotein n=1 Tax=Leptospira idonii TaxID=1193500 RepID=A0A4R9M2H4_9LEPT|nr:hypothetical protein [Leptospira idonii]TGN19927.1 hypothetical protein EHS15_05985 [Leptospira idonii]